MTFDAGFLTALAALITAVTGTLIAIGAGVKYLLDRADRRTDELVSGNLAMSDAVKSMAGKQNQLVDLFEKKINFDNEFFGDVREEMRSFHDEGRVTHDRVAEVRGEMRDARNELREGLAENRREVRDGNRVLLDRIAEIRLTQVPKRTRRNKGEGDGTNDVAA